MAETLSTAGAGAALTPADEHECKICYNDFDLERRTPKLLRCSHTFCLECLETLYSREGGRWRIGCPLCRHRTPVPEYRVSELPDNTAVTETLPWKKHVLAANTDEHADTDASSPATSRHRRESCQTCKQVAFRTGCVCAIFSLLSTAVLLFLGMIFIHNFNESTSPVGPVGPACLSVASVLALLSLILTWLMCVMKYKPETEESHFSSIASDIIT